MPEESPAGSASLVTLARNVVDLIPRLIRDEVATLRLEVTGKLKSAGIGLGLFIGAVLVACVAVGVLAVVAILSFSTVFPAWLAALVVAFVLLILTAALVAFGMRTMRGDAA